MEVFEQVNESNLARKLNAFSKIYIAFLLPSPVTLAASIIAAVTSSPSDREIIIQMCRNGEDYLQQLYYMMDDHPEYQLVKVALPFLEFNSPRYETFRIVSGRGQILGIKVEGGWITG